MEAVPQAPPKERSRKITSPKDKEKVKTVQKIDKRPQNDDKKEAPEDEPSLNHRTIFTDATDNPMTYLKITMLERRLKVKKITKEEFRNQHPYGAGHPRRARVGGQAISLNEHAFIMNVTSIPALNVAVALITDYVDGYYSASLLGAHRGQHVDDLRQFHLELIKQDKWPKLYDEDQLLYWDVRGIDNGVSFPNRTRGI